jgi:hypothetical protein
MLWIAQEKARVDRIRCPRLITVPGAEFLLAIAFSPTD